MALWIFINIVSGDGFLPHDIKPVSIPILSYCHLQPKNIFDLNFNKNNKKFVEENTFENVVIIKVAVL